MNCGEHTGAYKGSLLLLMSVSAAGNFNFFIAGPIWQINGKPGENVGHYSSSIVMKSNHT
jgi:hypothetical protein